jgi:hypothetical protein
VLATCLMVAYADGVLTGEELAAVRGVADEIGAPPARVDELLALVNSDYMLRKGRLARLPDAGPASVAVVARELRLKLGHDPGGTRCHFECRKERVFTLRPQGEIK